jgi:hypothetical protein
MPKTLIGVVGGHSHNTTPQALGLAERVGFEVGMRGMGVVCGGEDGVMEAACRGCKKSGGATIGIIKGNSLRTDRPYLDYAILTSMDVACNNIIIWSSAGVLAFDGKFGTLNEIALALDFGKPLISLGAHLYLKLENINSEQFAHYEGYDHARVPEILDRLESMIRAARK